MNVKKLLTFLGIALVVFWIVTAPASASGTVNNIGNWLYSAAQNVTTFLVNLF